MRLTTLLVALALLFLVAEPLLVRSVHEKYSSAFADPQDLPAASSGFPAPEAYQSKSEGYPRISGECAPVPEEHAAPQEYPSILREHQSKSEEYVIPRVNALTDEEYPGISREHQLVSEKSPSASEEHPFKSEEHAMPHEYQPISEEYLSASKEYAEGYSSTSEVSSVSGGHGSLTMRRAQSLESLVSLVNAVPALLISCAGLCSSLILACLSPVSALLGLLCSLPLCVTGALIGAISGTFASPVVTSFVCGGGGFSCGALIDFCIAFLCSEFCAVCYGGNAAACAIPWFFQLVWLAFSWSWISAGGFGLGMVIFLIIAAIALIIIALGSAICSVIPLVGWLPNWVWLAISHLCFTVVMILFFICFDFCWSICLPVAIIVMGIFMFIVGIAPPYIWAVLSGIGLIFGTIPKQCIAICMGCIYLTFDVVLYCPISLFTYCASLIATCFGILGWVIQCVAALPVSAVAGLFSGVACALPPAAAGFISGFIPVLGQAIGCLVGGCGGGALGCLVGLPVLPVLTLTAAAMSACVSLLAFASYVAERTRTSDIFLGVLRALGSFVTGITSAFTESARTIIGHLLPVIINFVRPLLKLLDVCISVVGIYRDVAPLFFALWYVVYAICASTGILSCCVGPCIAVPGMVCNFCAQVLWAFLVDQHLGGRAPALILEVLRESIR